VYHHNVQGTHCNLGGRRASRQYKEREGEGGNTEQRLRFCFGRGTGTRGDAHRIPSSRGELCSFPCIWLQREKRCTAYRREKGRKELQGSATRGEGMGLSEENVVII